MGNFTPHQFLEKKDHHARSHMASEGVYCLSCPFLLAHVYLITQVQASDGEQKDKQLQAVDVSPPPEQRVGM
jgi:hypothetical protein